MISKEKLAEYRKKAHELVGQMTLEEKVGQMVNNAPEIERLGIKSYNWWNEALHGVARAGIATVFPQAIGMAASFDQELIREIGDVVSTEGRAKFNLFQKYGDHGTYKGLTYWAPNVNIFRDPRWGRGHETYGEDPYLTGRMGVAYIKGIQGEDSAHLKAAACAKHYVVHSGPEGCRHGFDSKTSLKDFYETYLPAFKACVEEAGVEIVMGAYNSVNGELCCGSKKLIGDILRQELGFEGHFVSDCGAIADIKDHHMAAATYPEAAALALNGGCDLNCGGIYLYLAAAVAEGLVKEETIDQALERLFVTRYKLGIIGDEASPFDDIPYTENDSAGHKKLCLKAAEKCMTLLKNDGVLPLDKTKIKRVAVVGPNADSRIALQGNYNGTASQYYTVYDGLRAYLGEDVEVLYAQGCHLYSEKVEACAEEDDRSAEAAGVAALSDVVVVCLGLDATIEGEQGDAFNGDGSGDKIDLELPGLQNQLLERILKTGTPTIVVHFSGSAVNLSLAQERAAAVVQAWYPGAQGGLAVARMLFGEFSPAGRLPLTFYHSVSDLPDFQDYAMAGRTYRYFDKPVLYPFGYGLSYTSFAYSSLTLDKNQIKAGESVSCTVSVTNTGSFDSDEVVQLYLKDNETSVTAPRYQLKGFDRVFLKQGETKRVTLVLRPQDMELVLEDGSSVIEPGSFTVYMGGGQPNENAASVTFEVV